MCDETIIGKPVLVDGSAFCGVICAEAHDELVREHREVTDAQAAEMAEEHDPFLSDAEADADALASAGWGEDEAYFPFPDEGPYDAGDF